MDANKNITATFAIDTYTLNLTTVGNGTASKSPDQPSYNFGTVVQLTATPNAGQSFVGWTGDASGTANPLSVTMDGDKSITAQFTVILSVTVVGSGSVTKSPNQATYAPGTVVQLTATPAVGWHVVGWSGDASGTANPLSVTMDGNKNITATFAINTYTLSVTTVGNGTVTKSPNQATYNHGTVVQLTATPAVGWRFVGWSGDASGLANPLSVTMDGNKNITATFEANSYTLGLTTVGNGTASKSPDQPSYDYGTVVQLTSTPSPGQSFVGWTGDASGTTNPLDVTMDGDKSITAQFTVILSVTVVGSGSVTKSPNQATYAPGTVVQLTATPAVGWHVVGWSGDASGTANPLSVTMDGNKNITATFAINTYTLSVTTVGNGTVTKSPNQATYNHGTVVQLTATPAVGWRFVGWSGDASGLANPLSVTMDGNKNITATFEANSYTLGLTTVGNGTASKSPDQPSYDYGTVVQLTATPSPGQSFVGWTGDASGTTNPLDVTMDGDKSITAQFTVSLSVTVVGSGTVTKNPNQPNYAPGTLVQLTATPAAGWHF